MLTISDIKQGTICQINNEPYVVLTTQHVQMGRGGAILRLKLRNMVTGAVLDKTLKGNDGLDEADLSRSKVNFLYKDDVGFHFMDLETYEQFGLDQEVIGDAQDFLKENQEVVLLKSDDRPISIQLPPKVELTITSAPPGVKGDSAQGRVTKTATLETGATIDVPLFVNEGDVVRINTETGKYVERV